MGSFSDVVLLARKGLEHKYLKLRFKFLEIQFEKLLIENGRQKKEMETLKIRVGVLESKIKRLIFNSDD